MSISLCRRISMALVVCICASFCLLPFRSEALFTEIYQFAQNANSNPVTIYITLADLVLKMTNEMLSGSNQGEPLPGTIASIAAYWEPYVTTDAVLLTQDQMDTVIQGMKSKGITVERYHRGDWPDGIEAIRIVSTNIAGYDFAGEIAFGSFYTLDGRTVISKAEKGTIAPTTVTNNFVKEGDTTNITQETIFNTTTNKWETINNTVINNSSTTNNNTYLNEENNTWYDIENNEYKTFNDYSYNPTTNTYTVNFTDGRTYNYQFYYDYTYITYIGSSAEYREAYKVYYELPDGRSSGDLTVDDLKGISLQFDMVNYDKAASDTVTQFLYPFDGDIENTSYYPSSGSWISNPSTSYLESPEGFGGSLSLNSNLPMRLNFSVPNDSLSEWTLQFRYYANGDSSSSPFYVMASGIPTWYTKYLDYGWNHDGVFDSVDMFGFVNPIISSLTSKIGNNSWWSYSPLEVSAPLLTFFNGGLYAGLNDSVTGVDSVDETGFNSSSLFTFLPGQWYDITVCCYGIDLDNYVETYWSSDTPSQYTDWVSTDCYFIYVNGLLVGSYGVPVIYPGIGGSTSRNTYYLSSPSSLSLGWKRIWSNTTGDNIPTKITNSPIWAFSSLSSIDFVSTGSGYPVVELDNLRFLDIALYTGVQSFTPSPVPFDTNLVYVLPSVAELNDNTVAIMSQLPVTGYRVGGIRPTDPTLSVGYVWMHIDGDFVDSVQQWNGAYWEEVTARLYTGVRWIPVTAFNVFTLEDMFDIVDPDGDGGGESVSTIYQYYLWWSGEWGTFQQWLQGTMETLIEAIQNSGSGSGGPVTIVPGYNDQTTTNEITTENPDGSTTVTTIVSNAAGLVYSRSVTTWPPDADGNVTSREVYTDSSGVMYQTTIITDKDGNVIITEPSEATGTLASILKTITQGVMSIATSVIEAFVNLLVDLVGFVLDSVGRIFTGITNILATLLSAITSFVAELGAAAQFLPAFFSILPAPIQSGFTLIFVGCVAIGLFRLIHF